MRWSIRDFLPKSLEVAFSRWEDETLQRIFSLRKLYKVTKLGILRACYVAVSAVLRLLRSFGRTAPARITFVLLAVVFFIVRLGTFFSAIWFVILKMVLFTHRRFFFRILGTNLVGFVKDLWFAYRWTNLGAWTRDWTYRRGTIVWGKLAHPSRRWTELDNRWYWRGHMAMWLPDLMWSDLVKMSTERKKRRKLRHDRIFGAMAFFYDYPWRALWQLVLVCARQPLKLVRPARRVAYALRVFFRGYSHRVRVRWRVRALLVYHGVGTFDFKRGIIPAFAKSPFTFDFSTRTVVRKSGGELVELVDQKEVDAAVFPEEQVSCSQLSEIEGGKEDAGVDNKLN